MSHSKLLIDAKVMSMIWTVKTKTNGKLHRRLNAQGNEQLEGKHYHSDSITAPVTKPNTICIAWTLMVMIPYWIAIASNVEGEFLLGQFTNGAQMVHRCICQTEWKSFMTVGKMLHCC